jgi:hypothetical protein
LALEHARWVAARQATGFSMLRAMSNGSKGLVATDVEYVRNDSTKLLEKLRRPLIDWMRRDLHIFYGVNAFKKQRAIKEYVVPGRLAHVDADGVSLPPPGPYPTRIVRTSPGNHQFLYELDAFPAADQLEAINRYLTVLVGGDRGGHQLAKLLRMPGTMNWKPEYDPTPLVVLVPYDAD